MSEDRQGDRRRIRPGRLAEGRKRLADVVAHARPALENLAVGVGQDQLCRGCHDFAQELLVAVEACGVEDRRVVLE